jgi:hypothetical protein
VIAPPTLSPRARVVINTLTAALVLRLLHLGDLSLWADEGVTWWNSTHGGLADTVFSESNHPPVWWLVTRAWLAVFPGDEFALRAPAAVCGALSVFLAYRLSRRLSDGAHVPSRGGFVGGDGATAAWVVALAAANPFLIEYSQEARMYAALLAETLGLSLLYLRWLDRAEAVGVPGRGARGTLVAYALLASLALHTNYLAAWPIVAHAAHALWIARRGRSRGDAGPALSIAPLIVAQAAAALSFVPWFIVMVRGYRGISQGVYDPYGRLGHALWRMGTGPALVPLDAIRAREGPAAVFFEEPTLIVLTALAWFVPIGFGAWALRRDLGSRRFVGISILVPLALAMAAAVRWPLVSEKYLIFLAPFLLHLAVVGARAAPGLLRPVLLGGLVLLHVAGLAAYHFSEAPIVRQLFASGHRYRKEPWRDAHEFVARQRGAGDVVFVNAPFTRYAWEFYDREKPVPSEPIPPLDLPCDRALTLDEILARYPALAGAKQAFLVLSHASTDDPEHYVGVFEHACAVAWGSYRSDLEFDSLVSPYSKQEFAATRPDDAKDAFPGQSGIRVIQIIRPGGQ